MRTISKFRIVLGALSVICLTENPAKAQFQDALVVDDQSSISPVFAQNTGNYIIDINSITYAVSVYDDNNGPNAMLEWKVGTTTGFIDIDGTAQVLDPDVCIVRNQFGNIYALVAYYDLGNGEFRLRRFQWAPGQQQFNGQTPEVLIPAPYGSTINIDANDVGDFVIVWDQPGMVIQTVIGQSPGSQPPTLNFPGTVFDIDPGEMPDVSMYRSTSTGHKMVHYGYKNFGGYIVVDSYDFDDMINGQFSANQVFRSPAADLVYRYPRIDSPTAGIGSESDFTVVVEDSDNSGTWYIKGFNSNACCPGFGTYIYNDGLTSNSPFDLTAVPNTRPVVSYYNNGDGIMIGWNLDNGYGLLPVSGASMSRQPIALATDKKAIPFPGCLFLNVPFGIANGASLGLLSISGKYSGSDFYTYINAVAGNMQYKMVPHIQNASHLRTASTSDFYGWMESLQPAGTSETAVVSVQAFDLVGRQVYAYNGNVSELQEHWKQFSIKQPVGIYALFGYQVNGNSNFSGKVFTGY